MSWTDDTEALLRVPPNVFFHDSECDRELTENRFVKDLAKKIDLLRHRLDTLESFSFNESSTSALPFKNNIEKSFVESTPIKRYKRVDKCNTFPKRNRKAHTSDSINRPRHNSLPRRTKTKSKFDRRSLTLPKYNYTKTLCNYSTSSDSIEEIIYPDNLSNMESDISILSLSPERKDDDFMLCEINAFLNRVSVSEDKTLIRSVDDIVKNKYENLADLDSLLTKYISLDTKTVPQMQINTDMEKNTPSTSKEYLQNTDFKVENHISANKPLKLSEDIVSIESNSVKDNVVNESLTSKVDDFQESIVKHVPDNVAANPVKNVEMNSMVFIQNVSNDLFVRNPPSLPSLSKLWTQTIDSNKLDSSVESQKLEEEKLRRQHCENMIQQLQKKLLEQQQKIAVAIEVDSAKEDIIKKLRNVCTHTIQRIQALEVHYRKELLNLNLQIEKAHENVDNLNKMNDNKTTELDRANSMIKEYEEKLKSIDSDLNIIKSQNKTEVEEMKNSSREKEERISELKNSNSLIVQLNKQLSDNLTLAQNSLDKANEDETKLNKQISDFKRLNRSLEDEIKMLKDEKNDIATKISQEKIRNSLLDQQKYTLQNTIDEAQKTIELLHCEFDQFKLAVQSQKNEMKDYYQKQVESIVSKKVNEFQNELDSAKISMNKELQKNERDIAFQFAKHLQRVEQQHQHEISIIEDKNKEQIKLYKIQMLKFNKMNQQLEEKLVMQKNKRGEIAVKLHNVMETQWQQALKILSNGNSSEVPSRDGSEDFLNRVDDKNVKKEVKTLENQNGKTKEDTKLTEDKLQHYIKILLQKVPGLPDLSEINIDQQNSDYGAKKSVQFNGGSCKEVQEFEYPTSDRASSSDQQKLEKYIKMKRPWK